MEQDERLLRQAAHRARRKLGFIIHALVFVTVNALLFGIGYYGNPGYGYGPHRFWAVWPFFWWGIALLIHGIVAFGPFERIYRSLLARELSRSPADRHP